MQLDPAQLADDIETHGLIAVAIGNEGDEEVDAVIIHALRMVAGLTEADAPDASPPADLDHDRLREDRDERRRVERMFTDAD